MKLKTILITSSLITFLLLFSFQNLKKTPLDTVTAHYIERNNNFKLAIANFSQKVNSTSFIPSNLKTIKDEYFKLRVEFKKWEYLNEFIDPVFVKEYINGAPLPKIEANSFGPNIIEPKGLQSIDEKLFSDEALKSKQDIIKALNDMSKSLDEQTLLKIYDRDIFIAGRQALVRLYTLGVTGFDTPGSQHGIVDSKNVMSSIAEDVPLYLEMLKNKSIADTTTKLINGALSYLEKNTNFDTFDRLVFLKVYVNPLYEFLYKVHLELGFETPEEIMVKQQPVNYAATNLFDANFLKADYYNRVPKEYLTREAIDLGRTIFFDPLLSKNNQRACASCHSPEKAFTDQKPTSLAYGNVGHLKRNAPTLINSVYSEKYFHDMRAKSFEDQTEHVITSPEEFNTSFSEILEKINASAQYKALFKQTFKDNEQNIQLKHLQFALSAYVSSLQGLNSRFDKYVRGEIKTIPESVKNGYNLFMGKAACGTCHYAPIFNGTVPPYYKESESEVLGVAKNPYDKHKVLDPDEGRGNSLLKERVAFYKHSFKTPTVRNVELTYPYMHNGAYKTLEDVMDFYNAGGGLGQKLDVPTQTLGDAKLNLSKKEIKDLVGFMKSLTDTSSVGKLPAFLPSFEPNNALNARKIGGLY